MACRTRSPATPTPGARPRTFTWNAALWLTGSTAPSGATAAFGHDAAGNVTRVEYANGGPAAFWEETGFDGLGRILTTLGAMGQAWAIPMTRRTTSSCSPIR